MKTTLLTVAIATVFYSFGQEKEGMQKSVTIVSTISKDFVPDSFCIYVNLEEYEHVNPEDQKVTKMTMDDVERSVYKKIEEIGIKQKDVRIANIAEIQPNAYNYNYNLNQNYVSTQKRDLSKTLTFKVKSQKDLERTYVLMRLNGVKNVVALPVFSTESQQKIDQELIRLAMTNARKKADEYAVIIGKKLTNVLHVSEVNVYGEAQTAVTFNTNYYQNYYYGNNGVCSKSLHLSVTYEIGE